MRIFIVTKDVKDVKDVKENGIIVKQKNKRNC